MKNTYIIPASLILGIGIAMSGYFIKQGMIEHTAFNRYVSVKGLAEQTVKADQVVWQLNISFTADAPNTVYQGIETSQHTIQAFLIEQGFTAESITRQPISINDNSAYNQRSGSRYTGYTNMIISCSDVDRVNNASQRMNSLAAKNIALSGSTLTYSFTQLNSIKPTMLDEATTNAEAAAQAFAKNSHSQLAGIRNASQGQFTISDDNNSGMSSMIKKVRVVTSVEYFLKN